MLIGIDASRAVSDAPTGTETYSRELIRALLRIDRENAYRLYTRETVPREFFFSTTNGELRVANCEISAIPFPRAWTHARLSYEMLTRPPDLLWVPAHVLPLIHPRRAIVTVHDLGQFYFPKAYPLATRLYHFWSTRWNARVASHIFADSQATKDDLIRFCRVAPEKISVVYPAYDAHLYQPVRDAARIEAVRAKYRVGKNYIITVGTIHPRKNYTRLIEAFGKLGIGNWELVIVGKRGWLYDSIFAHARALKVDASVRFLDYVPLEDMPALLSGARAFVFPSLHEGFGLPILEAQSCGVPVICSNTSSLPEVAGQGALFVDPRDAGAIADSIARVLSDGALRVELIARGFENVKRFSWETSARKVLEILAR